MRWYKNGKDEIFTCQTYNRGEGRIPDRKTSRSFRSVDVADASR